LVLLSLGLVLVLGAAFGWLTRTDAGRALLVEQAVGFLNRQVLAGRVTVERLEGPLLGRFSLHGVQLMDAADAPVITLRRLSVSWEPLALLVHRQLRVRSLQVEGLHVDARVTLDGGLNLAELTLPAETPPSQEPTGPLGLDVVLEQIQLGDLRFEMRDDRSSGARLILVDHLSVVGEAWLASDWSMAAQLREVGFDLAPPIALDARFPVRLEGLELQLQGDSIGVQLAALRTGETGLQGLSALILLDPTGEELFQLLQAQVPQVQVAPEEVNRLVEGLGLLQPIDIITEVQGTPDNLRLELTADAGTNRVQVELAFDIREPATPGYRGTVELVRFRPHEVIALEGIDADVSALVTVRGRGITPADASAQLRVDVGPSRFFDYGLELAWITAHATFGEFGIDSLTLSGMGVELEARAGASLEGDLGFNVEAVVNDLASLRSFAPPEVQDLAGSVMASLQVQGRLPVDEVMGWIELPPFELLRRVVGSIRIGGRLALEDVQAAGVRVRELTVDASTSMQGEEPELALLLKTTDVDAGGGMRMTQTTSRLALRPESADLTVEALAPALQLDGRLMLLAAWQRDRVRVVVNRLEARQGRYPLRVDNNPVVTVRLDEAWMPTEVTLSEVSATAAGVNLSLGGSVDLADPAEPAFAAALRTAEVPLQLLSDLGGLGVPLGGVVQVQLRTSGTLDQPRLSLALAATDVSVQGLQDVEARLQVRFAQGELESSLEVRMADEALYEFATGEEAGIPLRVDLRRGRWRIDPDAPVELHTQLHPLELRRLGRLLESLPVRALQGEISARSTISGSLRDPQMRAYLRLAGLGAEVPGPLLASLGALPESGEAEVEDWVLRDVQLVAGTEYALQPTTAEVWMRTLSLLAGDALVARSEDGRALEVPAGCVRHVVPATLLHQGGTGEGQADGGPRGAVPGLRAALWADWQGCPVWTTDLEVRADLRPVLDDPGSLLAWAQQLAVQPLPRAQDRARAARFARWLDDVRLELHGQVGTLDVTRLPSSLRNMAQLLSGLVGAEFHLRGSRQGGEATVAVAADRLRIEHLPAASALAVVQLDNGGLQVRGAAGLGESLVADDLMPHCERGAESDVPMDGAIDALARWHGTWPLTMARAYRGEFPMHEPLEARLELVHVPVLPWMQRLGLDTLLTPGIQAPDRLAAARDATVRGWLDIAGPAQAPELIGRVMLRDLRPGEGQVMNIGGEVRHGGDAIEIAFFAEDGFRALADGAVSVQLPAGWRGALGSVADWWQQITWQVALEVDELPLQRVAAPWILGAWIDDVAGMVDMGLEVNGVGDRATFDGHVRMQQGRIGLIPLARRLEGIELDMTMTQDRIEINQARVGDATGRAQLEGWIDLENYFPRSMRVETTLRNFLLADPQGNGVFVSGRVEVAGGTTDDSVFSPTVTLDTLTVDVPDTTTGTFYGPTVPPPGLFFIGEDVAAEQVGRRDPQSLGAGEEATVQVPLRADVRVVTRGVNTLNHSLATARFEVDLLARIRDLSYALRGTVRVPQGNVSVAGKNFELRRGFVTFNGEVDTVNPVLDFRAVHVLSSDVANRLEPAASGEASVTVAIDGGMEELFDGASQAIRLQSDPPMSQEDIIFVLLTGRPRDASSEVEGDQQALATASSLAAGLLADRLLGATGIPIDTIRIDGDAQSGQAFARVEGGKYLSDDVYVSGTYINSQDPRENDFEFALEWIIARFALASIRGELRAGNRGNGGVELLYNITRPGRRRAPLQEPP
jgi:autotransporter translocation and assembly factor TamB